MKLVILACGSLLLSLPAVVRAEDCEGPVDGVVVTDGFFFSASSDQGAVGDVVAVELSLTVDELEPVVDGHRLEPPFAFGLVCSYDGAALELLREKAYSDAFDQLTFLARSFVFSNAENPVESLFLLGAPFLQDGLVRYSNRVEAVPLVTLYFRVKGTPGTTTTVRFTDDVLAGRACESSNLAYDHYEVRSTRHVPGVVRILEGEATHPDPPPVPENAKVYAESPTAENASIHFEVDGPPVTQPGAKDVPLEVYLTSNYEFSGFMVSLRFPPRYLQLIDVQERTRPGVVLVDNDQGGVGILMANSRRRVGREGERVHVATLRFDVEEAAEEVSELEVEFGPFENYFNWLAIEHREGLTTEDLPISQEVEPLVVGKALLALQREPTVMGDVNLDYELNVSDAVSLLGHLFLGQRATCAGAEDFNADERVNISDAVAILQFLFQGGDGVLEDARC